MIFVMKMQSCAFDDGVPTGFKRLISNGLNTKIPCRHDLVSDVKKVQVTAVYLKI